MDRELLELAAKAAELINARYHEATGGDYDSGTCILHDMDNGRSTHAWNPLIDDGDCARLENALEFYVFWQTGRVTCGNKKTQEIEYYADHGGDKGKARRYASTRAAAAIGAAMPITEGGGK